MKSPFTVLFIRLVLFFTVPALRAQVVPLEIGTWTLESGSSLNGVTLRNGYAYLAAGLDGLEILDISNPTAPQRVGGLNYSGNSQDIALVNNHVYLADAKVGLQAIDVSEPANPKKAGNWGQPWNTSRRVRASKKAAYLEISGVGIQRFDLSDPANPAAAGTYFNKDIDGVAAYGDYALTVAGGAFLVINGADMTLKTSLVGGYFGPVAVSDNFAIVNTSGSEAIPKTEIIDLRDPHSPRTHCTIDNRYCISSEGTGSGFFAVRRHAGTLLEEASPFFSSLSLNGDLIFNGRINFFPNDIEMLGNLIITVDQNRLRIFDPAEPWEAERISPASGDVGRSVVVQNGQAYVAGDWEGLKIFNVVDRSQPSKIGSYNNLSRTYDVDIYDTKAYLADRTNGLEIVDCSIPSAPKLLGSCALPGISYGVTVSNQLAYMACGEAGLRVVSVTDSSAPKIIGALDTPGNAEKVILHDRYAFILDDRSLQIADVFDPSAPQKIGAFSSKTDRLGSMSVRGAIAFVANVSQMSLMALDISSPAAPQVLDSVSLTWQPRHVIIAGSYAFIGTWGTGAGGPGVSDLSAPGTLDIVDISQPAHLRIIASTSPGSFMTPSGLFADDQAIYAVGYSAGLAIIAKYTAESRVTLNPLVSRSPGVFRQLVRGPSNLGGRIFRSKTLDHWEFWKELNLGVEGVSDLYDPDPGDQKFYKFVSP